MANSRHQVQWVKLFLLIAILVPWGCQSSDQGLVEGPPLGLSLAMQQAPNSGLVAIAVEKGYFKEAGLKVSLSYYPSGRKALEAVCRGEALVATVSDIAFAAKALEDTSIRVLASIGTNVGSQIVARRDRNIQNPADLKGKKVGFSANTTSDYFLYAFLVIENIPREDIIFVDIPAARQVEALVNGEVDAVSAFELHAFEAKERLGENAVYWDVQNNVAHHWLLAVEEGAAENPEPLERLLEALIKAEDFARAHEEETKSIVSRMWGFEPEFLRQSWPKTRLNVSFGQSVVASLQNYTRWQAGRTGTAAAPLEVLNYLHTDVLDEVAPHLVKIFR